MDILIPPYIAKVWGVSWAAYIMALKSCSVLNSLLPIIIIIMQECSQALRICKCLWSLPCGGVSNMLLVLSITFHCHHYIWDCMCSTGPFQFMWLKGYIHSSCYYHYQIGSINLTHYHIFSMVVCTRCLLHRILSLIAYTFQENRDFGFIIIVQFMMSVNIRIRFGLQIVFVCLYITPSHYHHCAYLSEDIELIKYLSDIFCRVCK